MATQSAGPAIGPGDDFSPLPGEFVISARQLRESLGTQLTNVMLKPYGLRLAGGRIVKMARGGFVRRERDDG